MTKEYSNSQERIFKMYGKRIQLENPWLRVIDYDTETDGCAGKYTVVERRDAAIMILEHSRRGILFLNSYRYPIEQTLWELPAGGIEANEEPLEAAVRETKEETGLDLASLQLLGSFLPLPGLTPQRVYVFYQKISDNDLKKALQFNQPVDEIVARQFFTRDQIKDMIKSQELQSGLTLAALTFLDKLSFQSG